MRLKNKGSILPITVLLMTAVLIIGTGLLMLARGSYMTAGVEQDQKRAFYVAEAGIERAIYDLNSDSNWIDGTPVNSIYTNEALTYSAGGVTYSGTYTVTLINITQKDMKIVSSATVNNSQRQIAVRVGKLG
jgi:hypothetical protein